MGVVKVWGCGIVGFDLSCIFIKLDRFSLLRGKIIRFVVKPIIVNSNKLSSPIARL